jgi:plastocyanin
MKRLAVPITVAAMAAAAPAEAAQVTVTMPGKYFDPGSVSLVSGDEVLWRNMDFVEHNVRGPDGIFDSGHLGRLGSFSFRFDAPGEYGVICTLHTFMSSTVRVSPALLTAPPDGAIAGEAATFSGRAAAGTTVVTVEREVAPGAWQAETDATPAADGTFTAQVMPTETASYRATVAGAAGTPVVLRVDTKLTVAAAVHRGKAATRVHVRTAPGRPGATALLETYSRERFAWRKVARVELDKRGRASFSLPRALRRVARVRILRAPGGPELGMSAKVKLHPKALGPAKVIRPEGSHGTTPDAGTPPDTGTGDTPVPVTTPGVGGGAQPHTGGH